MPEPVAEEFWASGFGLRPITTQEGNVSHRRSYAFALAIALVLSGLASSGSSADPPQDRSPTSGGQVTAEAVSPTSATVTLITGDVVTLETADDGRQSVTVRPAVRADGRAPDFNQYVLDDQLFVVPDDMMSLVPERLDRNLFNISLLASSGLDDASTDGVQVILQNGATTTSRKALPSVDNLPGVTAERRLESIGAVAAAVDKQEATGFVASAIDAGVERIWLDAPLETTDVDSAPQIGAPTAWDLGFTGEGVRIAVLDTGIDEEHPDLSGAVVAAQDFSGGGDPDDHQGHGTHVASTAAGRGVGDAVNKGMAYDADLINGKILNDSGNGEMSWLIDGLEWASGEQDADIVNLSIGVRGYYTDGTDPWSEAVNSVVEGYGTLVVAAAGNDGRSGINPPGAADLALTVGAVDDWDYIAPFSGRGPRTGDWALKPDLTAPGMGIIAALADGASFGNPVDDLYTAASGTSMATPHVSGAAALLMQQRPELTGQQVKSLLMGTAEATGLASVWDEGTGRLFVPTALEQTTWAEPASLSLGYHPYPHEGDPVVQDLTYRNSGESEVTLTLTAEVTDEQGNAPAPEQFSVGANTLVVPAGGTATVPVTLDLAAGETGLYSGAITATDLDGREVRTTVGWFKEPVMMDLTVDVTNRDGEPAGGQTTVDVVNVDNYEQYFELNIPVVDGQASLRVPPGTYSVMAYVADYDDAGAYRDRLSSVMEPEVDVTADSTVTLDARDAAPATVDTGRPVEITSQAVGQMRQDANGRLSTHSWTLGSDTEVFAAPTEEVTIGGFEYYTRWSLEQAERDQQWRRPPRKTPTPYTYDVVFPESVVPDVAELAYIADETNTVAIDTSYRASAPDSPVGTVRHMWRPYDQFSFTNLQRHTAPVTRTEYVSTGDSRWAQYLYAYSTPTRPFDGLMMSAPRTYPTAGRLSTTWLHAALRGGLKPDMGSPVDASAYRDGDMLGLDVLTYVDNSGHFMQPFAQEDSFSTQLYADGQLLLSSDASGWAQVQVPAGVADYRLVADATRDQEWWTSSTRQHTEWEFSSDTTSEATVLPLLDVSMVPQRLDELNHATKRNTVVELDVTHQDGSHGPRIKGVRAWWSSDDGVTWEPAQMKHKKGDWTAKVKAPKGSGPISLKVQAWDAAGSRVTQEVIRAYVADG